MDVEDVEIINIKVRPRKYFMLFYGFEEKVYIHFYPQQKWKAEITSCSDIVELRRNRITVQIKKSDFEKYFKEIQK
ncbi:MAG: hypothetical protein J6T10_22865 [Methanobrevibacter sp.]|nr:hypothetical protein [Methanobrevibacter sp.]